MGNIEVNEIGALKKQFNIYAIADLQISFTLCFVRTSSYYIHIIWLTEKKRAVKLFSDFKLFLMLKNSGNDEATPYA